ncbi:MAG: polyribonucleotide nucleotidyltransferase [Nitrospirae bacterium]|nr:polyribonucleotide nucleotidyltransferase [Nitrospirota bacterium]
MVGFERRWKRGLSLILCVMMSVQLVSCGTILYPEREGQRSGEVDLAVVLMDGIGLFFFILPGVVAFAVDFYTGAVYLPPGHPRSRLKDRHTSEAGPIHVVKLDPKRLNAETISKIVLKETGYSVRFDDPALTIRKASPNADISSELILLSR